MVEEPVDGGGGQGLGYELTDAGGLKIRVIRRYDGGLPRSLPDESVPYGQPDGEAYG